MKFKLVLAWRDAGPARDGWGNGQRYGYWHPRTSTGQRRNPRTSPSRTSFSPLSSPLGGQAFDERRELPVRVIPDNDAAILELLLKLLVQVGGKVVHSMGSRK